jgi:hypothetical protein
VARALGVSPSTVAGWESGRDPSGEVREKYAYFLDGARTKLTARDTPAGAAEPSTPRPPGNEESGALAHEEQVPVPDAAVGGRDDVEVLPAPRPCVLCGAPARHQMAGCPSTGPGGVRHGDGEGPAASPEGATGQAERAPEPAATRSSPNPVTLVPAGRRARAEDDGPDLIGQAVAAALDAPGGDLEAATAALVRRAIPDAMALLDSTRKGGRYDIVAHPRIPDVPRKQTARGADQIWEARPKWTRPGLPPGAHEVTALDVNGAYLSALKATCPSGSWSNPPVPATTAAGPVSI